MLIKNARLLTDAKNFVRGDIEFDSVITAVGDIPGNADIDAGGDIAAPGLVDIHSHGAVGCDASDGSAGELASMSLFYAENGVTSWCPTTMTLPEDRLAAAMRAARDFRPEGAGFAGINLEGPFLSFERRGAQAAANLRKPDIAMFRRLNEASGGAIRLVTVACEQEGALDFIRAVSKDCTVSLGHSSAGYDEAIRAFEAGASHVTHLFNGMNGLGHRAPGIPGAAMDSGATAELISDGLHVHPSVVRAARRLFGERLVLISDSLRCAGMPDGEYELGGQKVFMRGGRATLADGTLAGSSVSLLEAVRRAVSFGLSPEDALRAASAAPAKVIGKYGEIGSLAPGKNADIIILGGDLTLKAVFIGGKAFRLRR